MENHSDGAGTAPAPLFFRRTVKVIVRHSADCKDRKKGSEWRRCRCPKSLLIYDGGGSGANRRVSAKTRSWEQAEKQAQEILDSWNPEKQELKRLRAEKERKQVRIEQAVALYIADMITRLGDNGTVAMARSLLGNIHPDSKVVLSKGHFFEWLDKLPQRPTFISEITPAHLTSWRASWKFGSDLTAANRWTMVKGFFSFCESQDWIDDTPARKLKPIEVEPGNRTTIFTDAQYDKILEAVSLYDPENTPEATRKNWQDRLRAFVQLMRWSGMALIDAVQFRPEQIGSDGILRYRRQKTGGRAFAPIPRPVLEELRAVPPERDSVGAAMPFRTRDVDVNSDTRKWGRRVQTLFQLAGIDKVQTEHGMRPPHPHMLRDTFAVGHLRKGAALRTVSKMLGHAKTMTTEKAYLPWVDELEKAHIADARKSMKKQFRS